MSGAFKALAEHREQVRVRASMAETQRNLDALPPVERVEATEVRAPQSDLEALRDAHEVESSYKPESVAGFRVVKKLSREDERRIDEMTGPMGDALRLARAEGRINWDRKRGAYIVTGVKAPEPRRAINGHFAPGTFGSTARRYARERGEGIR
jgi:hypothetical protein